MNFIVSSVCFTIKPPPLVLSSSAKENNAAASKSEVKGSLRFSERTEKGKMNRLVIETFSSDMRIPSYIVGFAFLRLVLSLSKLFCHRFSQKPPSVRIFLAQPFRECFDVCLIQVFR